MSSKMPYLFKQIEKKWQNYWEQNKIHQVKTDPKKPKFYPLVEFPYPSGKGLHVGHTRPFTAMDIIARKRRMQGFNVLFPMGWDSFGLPTENFAIKNKIHPKIVTETNVANFKKQIKSLGYSIDWSREINTTSPEYYKWTQWIFLQLFKNNLTYKQEMDVNWCCSCKCVLANEEVVNGKCERCGNEVIKKKKSQWMLKITEYANRLIDDLKDVNYLNAIKLQQTNWIGKSTGAEISFKTTSNSEIKIFTSKPETIFGVTFVAISPNHPFIEQNKNSIENYNELKTYISEYNSMLNKANLTDEKLMDGKEVKGILAINPLTKQQVPIFISNYVLMDYATGAIMAVPAHDSRDLEFAKLFNLPIIKVFSSEEKDATLINSSFLNGLTIKKATDTILQHIVSKKLGVCKTNFKLRDWIFARQRYWGEPIPIIHCPKCGAVALDESELPLLLPETLNYTPTETGESPLAKISSFVNVTCPKCNGAAKRETDTMPQWAGSSWYYIRYCSPNCNNAIAEKEDLTYWLPVDWYNGGMEHTTLHLLYSRFWHKFLYDIGVVNFKEPYLKRTSQGLILGSNGEKMSKSRGNVVNPIEIVEEFGADTLRLFVLFIGDFEKPAPWNNESIKGCHRFLERFWNLLEKIDGEGIRETVSVPINQLIKKVSHDIEQMKFNTAISAMMTFLNTIYSTNSITITEFEIFNSLLFPFAPHICSEINEKLGHTDVLDFKKWPNYDSSKCVESFVEIVVQINGKIKSKLSVPLNSSQQDLIDLAKNDPKVSAALSSLSISRTIAVPNKLVNFIAN